MSCSSDCLTVLGPDALNSLDEGFKSSSYLTETLLDPELGHSYESNKTAFNKAHNTKEDLWTWFEAPGNRLRLARFGTAMNGVEGSLIVDVGGGVGSQSLVLANHYPHLRFIVQDREAVVRDAVEVFTRLPRIMISS